MTREVTGDVLTDEAPAPPVALAPLNVQIDGQAWSFLVQRDGDVRLHDLDLAERVGLAQPRHIRAKIKEHAPRLERFGPVLAKPIPAGPNGGRPGTAYYLNRQQALFIAAQCETETAHDVLELLVRAFELAITGRLSVPALPGAAPNQKRLPGRRTLTLRMTGVIEMRLDNDERWGSRCWVRGEDEAGNSLSVHVPGDMLRGMDEQDEVALDLTVERARLVRRAESL